VIIVDVLRELTTQFSLVFVVAKVYSYFVLFRRLRNRRVQHQI
jgi:hypothetical protein